MKFFPSSLQSKHTQLYANSLRILHKNRKCCITKTHFGSPAAGSGRRPCPCYPLSPLIAAISNKGTDITSSSVRRSTFQPAWDVFMSRESRVIQIFQSGIASDSVSCRVTAKVSFLQARSVRRMRAHRQPSWQCNWTTTWRARRCSTGRCRTTNPKCFSATSSQESGIR